MKLFTTTKLELQAALLAVRLRSEIQKALTKPVERTIMWIDSTTVPQWLKSTDNLHVFVANRKENFPELTPTDE